VVDDERRKCFAFDILGDDKEGLACLGDFLEHGQKILHAGNLLIVDEDKRILEDHGHGFAVCDEIRRDVASVELHAFDEVDGRLHGFGFLNRDDAVFADFVHYVRDQRANLLVLGGDGGNVADLSFGGDANRLLEDGFRNSLGGSFDTALQQHRVGAGSQVLETFADNRVRENGGSGGAIASDIVGLGGSFLEQLSTHVLIRVLELDFLGYSAKKAPPAVSLFKDTAEALFEGTNYFDIADVILHGRMKQLGGNKSYSGFVQDGKDSYTGDKQIEAAALLQDLSISQRIKLKGGDQMDDFKDLSCFREYGSELRTRIGGMKGYGSKTAMNKLISMASNLRDAGNDSMERLIEVLIQMSVYTSPKPIPDEISKALASKQVTSREAAGAIALGLMSEKINNKHK